MRDLLECFVLPIIKALLIIIPIIFIAVSIVGFKSKECKVWGGEYQLETGCLMKVDGKMVTLSDYKDINRASIEKKIGE